MAMRIILLVLVFAMSKTIFAQTVSEANVYPSNLEENMYFENFNQSTNSIEGLYFMLLSDGDNSEHVTPSFEVSLYLLPEGSNSAEDIIVVKKYSIPGIHHFGSMEYKNETISLNETPGIKAGNYRFGIWVNSNEAFNENRDDNATLFKTPVTIVNDTKNVSEVSETKSDDDNWDDDWDDEDDDNWDDDDSDW